MEIKFKAAQARELARRPAGYAETEYRIREAASRGERGVIVNNVSDALAAALETAGYELVPLKDEHVWCRWGN
jgi:hypothetical protein